MADVFLNLLDPLEARFSWGDKSEREIELARRDIVGEFSRYSIEELEALYRRVVLTRKFRTMPNVADLRQQMDDMLAARKEAEAKPKTVSPHPTGESFMEHLGHLEEDAKQRGRNWLRETPLGQEALRGGWCRPLFEIVWRIFYCRARDGKPIQRNDEIRIPHDICTQLVPGPGEDPWALINQFRGYCGLSPGLERAIILKEKLSPEYDARVKEILTRHKRTA